MVHQRLPGGRQGDMPAGPFQQNHPEAALDTPDRLGQRRLSDQQPSRSPPGMQLRLTDLDALNASFTMPGVFELIERWQSRYPYKAIWVNHQPLG
ncbi:hypothetical protein [Winogradskya humida]